MNPRQVLKQLLKRDKLLVAPGCFDGLSARLVEEAGFEAAYLSGGAVARSMGIPDIGLVTMSEVIERARASRLNGSAFPSSPTPTRAMVMRLIWFVRFESSNAPARRPFILKIRSPQSAAVISTAKRSFRLLKWKKTGSRARQPHRSRLLYYRAH